MNIWLSPSIAQSLTVYKMHVYIVSQSASKRGQLNKQKEIWYVHLIIAKATSIYGDP